MPLERFCYFDSGEVDLASHDPKFLEYPMRTSLLAPLDDKYGIFGARCEAVKGYLHLKVSVFMCVQIFVESFIAILNAVAYSKYRKFLLDTDHKVNNGGIVEFEENVEYVYAQTIFETVKCGNRTYHLKKEADSYAGMSLFWFAFLVLTVVGFSIYFLYAGKYRVTVPAVSFRNGRPWKFSTLFSAATVTYQLPMTAAYTCGAAHVAPIWFTMPSLVKVAMSISVAQLFVVYMLPIMGTLKVICARTCNRLSCIQPPVFSAVLNFARVLFLLASAFNICVRLAYLPRGSKFGEPLRALVTILSAANISANLAFDVYFWCRKRELKSDTPMQLGEQREEHVYYDMSHFRPGELRVMYCG
jgi:hypothetical protein